MPTLVCTLSNTGTLYACGNFDEVTKTINSVDSSTVYSALFDEVTLFGQASLQQRKTSTGSLLVSNGFDEITFQSGLTQSMPGIPAGTGGIHYISTGTFTWTVPAGVTSVSVVAVGGGGTGTGYGGGGGALRYANNILVTPGQTYIVAVGWTNVGSAEGRAGTSSFSTSVVAPGGWGGAIGGGLGGAGGLGGSSGGNPVGTGGNGGKGGADYYSAGVGYKDGGSGGAGGYSGNGGDAPQTSWTGSPTAGAGGGGGGGGQGTVGYGGGGVGVYGLGSNGTAAGSGTLGTGAGGGGGSGGTTASGSTGGLYGGGGHSPTGGGAGTVRIIWPGDTRQFPSTGALNAISETVI